MVLLTFEGHIILCHGIVGCLVASLTSTHYILVSLPLLPTHVSVNPKFHHMLPNVPWGRKPLPYMSPPYRDFLSYLCNLSGHQGWFNTDTISTMVHPRRWRRGNEDSSERPSVTTFPQRFVRSQREFLKIRLMTVGTLLHIQV